jgi:2'-5' RNA ligase
MRLFVGVDVAPGLVEAVAAVVLEVRRRAERLAPQARITWVAPERLHLTVAFIGEADDERTRRIHQVLERPVAVAPFDLVVTGLGAFPTTGEPRVLWAGLTEGRDALQRVEREVSSRLAAAEIAREPRAYSPHLTLARVREAAGLRAASLFDGRAEDAIGTTRVEAITLFESRLSSKGPTYVPLQRTPLHT